MKSETAPINGVRQGETQERDSPLLVGGSCHKQRKPTHEACPGRQRGSGSPHSLVRCYECMKTPSRGSVTCTTQVVQHHIAFSRLCPWSSLWEREGQAEPISHTWWGWGVGASGCPGPAPRSVGSHISLMMSLNTATSHTPCLPLGLTGDAVLSSRSVPPQGATRWPGCLSLPV